MYIYIWYRIERTKSAQSVLPHLQDTVGFCQKVGQVGSHERQAEHGDVHRSVAQRHLQRERRLVSVCVSFPHSCTVSKLLTFAMSQTVTRSQTAARSKLCTLFFTLRAILQSPQPKSATTRDGGLERGRASEFMALNCGKCLPVRLKLMTYFNTSFRKRFCICYCMCGPCSESMFWQGGEQPQR